MKRKGYRLMKNLSPNTYIDAELAEHLMGWSIVQAGEEEWLEKAIERGARFPVFAIWPEGGTMVIVDGINPTNTRDFRPTADSGHAIEVLEMLKTKQYKVVLTGEDWHDGGEWKVEIFHPLHAAQKEPLAVETDPSNLPLAISKAALKAVRMAL